MTDLIGKSALDLTRSSVPADIRSEAVWWCMADGNRGTKIYYDGEEHGIHWWASGVMSKFMLKSKPKPLSPEDVQQLESKMKWYYERERERMMDELDVRESIIL